MQTIASILDVALSVLRSIDASDSIRDAVDQMCELDVCSLLVTDDDAGVVGILRERDIIRGVIAAELDPSQVTARQVMSNDLVIISPHASLDEAMRVMNHSYQQELVVAEDGLVCGLVSHCEISNVLMDDRDALIGDLTFYITHG